MLLIGQPPTRDRKHGKRTRAARATVEHVAVTHGGVTWRSRTWRHDHLDADEEAHVYLVKVDYPSPSAFAGTVVYALVIDRTGTVRLRVTGSSYWRLRTARRRLIDVWEPLGVLTVNKTPMAARAKDARRQWPEAFSLAGAYPFVTAALVIAGWVAIVVPVLNRLSGA